MLQQHYMLPTRHQGMPVAARLRRAATAIAAATALAACGGVAQEGAEQAPEATAAEEGATQAPRPVLVGTGANVSEGNFFILEQSELAAEEGIDLEVVLFDLGLQGVEAAIAGQTNAGVSVELPLLRFLDQGSNIVAPAVVMTANDIEIIVERDIETPADLVGKTIGLPFGSNMDYAFRTYLERHGLTDQDVTLLNVAPAEHVALLSRGDIDGFVFVEPVVGRAFEALGDQIAYLEPGLEEVHTSRLWLQFDRTWAEENREAVEGLLAGLIAAEDLAADDPDQAFQHVASKLGLSPEDARRAYEAAGYDWEVYVDDEAVGALQTVAEWMVEQDLIDDVPDYGSIIDTSYLSAVDQDRVRLSGAG